MNCYLSFSIFIIISYFFEVLMYTFLSSQWANSIEEWEKNEPTFLCEMILIFFPWDDFFSALVWHRSVLTVLLLCEWNQTFLDLWVQALFIGPMFLVFFCLGVAGCLMFLLGGGQCCSTSSNNSKAEDASCSLNVTTVAFICFPLALFFPPHFCWFFLA